jgi:hypothetical protein
MNDKELFAHAIGVQPPWQIKEVRMDVEAQRVEVEVECAKTVWVDPETQERAHVRGYDCLFGTAGLPAAGYVAPLGSAVAGLGVVRRFLASPLNARRTIPNIRGRTRCRHRNVHSAFRRLSHAR